MPAHKSNRREWDQHDSQWLQLIRSQLFPVAWQRRSCRRDLKQNSLLISLQKICPRSMYLLKYVRSRQWSLVSSRDEISPFKPSDVMQGQVEGD